MFSSRITESGEVRTTFRRNDVIYKTVGRIVVGIIVLHGNFDIHTIPGSLTVNDIRVQCLLAAV